MINLIKAFFCDTFSWLLTIAFISIVIIGLTALFNRYDRLERYKEKLYYMENDVQLLKNELDRKEIWVKRLESDPTAWEQVARDKMNYLGPEEILVTFVPVNSQ